jgi:acyl-CoA oxidase
MTSPASCGTEPDVPGWPPLPPGRLLVAQAAVDAAKLGLTIALRYSCRRTQWGERTILSYLTHQRRLLPGLAATYALHAAMKELKQVRGGSPAGSQH